jgi:Mn2+/Fe2+ NRAMP family transporter
VCVVIPQVLRYREYARLLKWLAVLPLMYFIVLIIAGAPWHEVFEGLRQTRLSGDKNFWLMVVAILGTTISPYLFFWQAAQEAEEARDDAAHQPGVQTALSRIRADTLIGMMLSNLVAIAILITSAAAAAHGGAHELTTAAQAAEAMRPAGGQFGFLLFLIGVVGSGLLAVPVLAGATSYAIAEACNWPASLVLKPLPRLAFYPAILISTLLAVGCGVAGVQPVGALVAAALINGVVAVPVTALLLRLAVSPRVLGALRLTGWPVSLGWATTGLLTVATLFWAVSAL